MEDVRVLEIKQSVFANNDVHANELRERLRSQGTFLLNLMSSPGSGKTTTLARTIETLRDDMSLAVMEADIDSDVDAKTIAQTGARAIQLHTGGMCHLDAYMTGPEGDDKPLKYPLMFSICDVVLINKIDALPIFDTFSMERARENILMRNPNATIIPICAKTGEGVDQWAQWLRDRVAAWKADA